MIPYEQFGIGAQKSGDEWMSSDEYVRRNAAAYSGNPTPSGGNFGNSVTGAQDIYDDYQSGDPAESPGFYSLTGSGNEYDASKYSLTGGSEPSGYGGNSYSGDAGMSVQRPYVDTDPSNDWWGDSGWTTFNESKNKMSSLSPSKSSGSGGSSGGGSSFGGSSGGTSTTGGETLAESREYQKSLTDAQNAEWERRLSLEAARKRTSRALAPPGEMPGAPGMPEFAAPTRDEGKIKELTQQKSAAGLRAMRAQIQKAMGQGYRNANVKRMTLRDALAGYGEGIENVMSGAQSQAGQEYNQEYAKNYDTAAKNWQTQIATKNQDWQNQVNNYLRQYGQESTG